MKNRSMFQRPGARPGLFHRVMALLVALSMLAPVLPVQAQPPPGFPVPPAPGGEERAPAGDRARGGAGEKLTLLNFKDAPLDQVLMFVEDLKGRTIIKSPGLSATITLKSQTRLSITEAMQAIETVLNMNNIALVPMGDKFLKAVQTPNARQEGMPIQFALPDDPLPEADQLVSQVIVLQHTDLAEIQPIIQTMLHGYGKIQPLERNNSLLVTDTSANIRRVLELLAYIDVPVDSKIETRIYEIRFAKASEIASRLNELIADSQSKEEKPRAETAGTPQSAVPAAIQQLRPGRAQPAAQETETAAQMAERGVIRGKVKIIADERMNLLFVISRAENFVFFDRIVETLDRAVDPDIAVRVVSLEYAKADEISGILNEFVGAVSTEKGEGAPEGAAAGTENKETDARSQALRDFVKQRAEQRAEAAREVAKGDASFGRLSPDTKILADKRTNSLLLMGRRSDLDALLRVIDSLDIMLAQVLIEAVILEINLGNGIETGIDWLQRSVTAYQTETRGPGGGLTTRNPVMSFGGGSQMSGQTFRRGNSLTTTSDGNDALTAGSLSYFLTFTDLNLDAVIRLAASSRDARILSTPVVLTTDNTEAKINIGEERPVVTSSSTYDTGTQTQNYEYRNIGLDLTVTPRINPQRYVVMEIAQKADNVGGFEVINGNNVPIITKREINAQIAVNSRNTIVLGGLVNTDKTKSRTKVPILGDIPLLGALFRYDSREEARTELLVLITPYVMLTPQEAEQETVRLHKNSLSSKTRWHEGWTGSALPSMTKAEMDRILKERETVATNALVRDIFGGPPDAPVTPANRDQVDTFVLPADGSGPVELPDEPVAAPQPAALTEEAELVVPDVDQPVPR